MYRFGSTSRERLSTTTDFLQRVLNRAMGYQVMDFTIVCGHRGEAEQNYAFSVGNSRKQWPDSNHNTLPSPAVDIAPWSRGIDWKDSLAFARLYGLVEAAAVEERRETGETTELRWGGDWDRDGESNDQSFMDIGHLEEYHPE